VTEDSGLKSALYRDKSSVGQPAPQGEGGDSTPDGVAEGIPRDSAPSQETVDTSSAGPGEAAEERIALSAGLWLDPDVRWLCGVHQAQGHSYLVREPYEELLWWLLMPSLLRLAGEAKFSRKAAEEMSRTVEEALASAKAAGYRIDALLGVPVEESKASEAADETPSAGPEETQIEPKGPVTAAPEISQPPITP